LTPVRGPRETRGAEPGVAGADAARNGHVIDLLQGGVAAAAQIQAVVTGEAHGLAGPVRDDAAHLPAAEYFTCGALRDKLLAEGHRKARIFFAIGLMRLLE
jgi:hypothetical protein